MEKAVFFDIDGTLWDEKFQIPDSTKEAIIKLKENKIFTFLCSGRTKAFITDPELLGLGFDGMVAGCGTYVEYEGKIISEKRLNEFEIKKMITFFKKHKIPAIMEGSQNLYLDEEDFKDISYPNKMKKLLGEKLLSITGNEPFWEVNKFSCGLPDKEHRDILKTLSNEYEVLLHDMPVAELLPKGYGKFFGIQEVCKYLNIEEKNTYAFGDSVNDLDMLTNAGHGIAMGSGSDFAKNAAEYITNALHEDGIYNGLKHYGLIK